MIKQIYEISAPAEKVWQALTDPEIIEQWSGALAVMDADESTEFSLWGGDIWGKNTKMIPNKLIEQDWYGGKWPEPSKLTIEFSEEGGATSIILTHVDVPEKEEQDFADGWRDYYFGPMKDLLEAS